MFISLKLRVSKSSSDDLVIFNQILSVLLNLFCNESNTWLKELSPSQVTWMVLLYDSCGAHEHGEISGRIEQWSDATCTIDTSVYTSDPIFYFPYLSACLLMYRSIFDFENPPVCFVSVLTQLRFRDFNLLLLDYFSGGSCGGNFSFVLLSFFVLNHLICHLDKIDGCFILDRILHKNDVVF